MFGDEVGIAMRAAAESRKEPGIRVPSQAFLQHHLWGEKNRMEQERFIGSRCVFGYVGYYGKTMAAGRVHTLLHR